MEITIIGSGGFLPTGLPYCECNLCKNASPKNKNLREGPSMYFDDLNLLIDMPENIFRLLPKYGIKNINNIIFSHWHPDHTQGHRLIEYLHYSLNKNKVKPIIYMNPVIRNTFKSRVPAIFYYAEKGYVSIKEITNKFFINDAKIKVYNLKNGYSVAYLIAIKDKKILVCMDHSKDLDVCDDFNNLDLLIINLGIIKKRCQKENYHKFPFINNITTFNDNLRLIKTIKPKKTIFIHLEPLWNLSYDDYLKLEKKYEHWNISFSYDGMKIKY